MNNETRIKISAALWGAIRMLEIAESDYYWEEGIAKKTLERLWAATKRINEVIDLIVQ